MVLVKYNATYSKKDMDIEMENISEYNKYLSKYAQLLLKFYQGRAQIRRSLYMYPTQLILSMGHGFSKVTISQYFSEIQEDRRAGWSGSPQ